MNYERSQNVETASRLAGELTKAGRHDEAIRVCSEARTGLFEDDPKILLALSSAQFAAGAHGDAIATLDYLRDKNPGFRSADGHLVYARALDESGATDRALEEYTSLVNYYPGAEARVRQAMLYKKLGDKRPRRRAVRGNAQGRAARAEAFPAQRARVDRARRARERKRVAARAPDRATAAPS